MGERNRLYAVDHKVRQQVGALGNGAAAMQRLPLVNTPATASKHKSRLPETKGHRLPGRPVLDDGTCRHTDQCTGLSCRVSDRCAGEDERRERAVVCRHPAQPAHQDSQMRAEDPSVNVAFINHDVAQRSHERSPSLVAGQQRVMHQVGVGQNVLAVVADPAAFVRWGVAVVGRSAKPRDGQRGQARHLVGGQSLGGAQIEGGGAPTGRGIGTVENVREHRQEIAEALARRCAGRDDDVRTAMRKVGGLALMRPQLGDAGRAEGRVERWGNPVGPWHRLLHAGRHLMNVNEPFPAPPAGQAREHIRGVEGPSCRRQRISGHRSNRIRPAPTAPLCAARRGCAAGLGWFLEWPTAAPDDEEHGWICRSPASLAVR